MESHPCSWYVLSTMLWSFRSPFFSLGFSVSHFLFLSHALAHTHAHLLLVKSGRAARPHIHRCVASKRPRHQGPLWLSLQHVSLGAELAAALVVRRVQVNARALHPQRVTALHMAIRKNDVASARLLLQHPSLDLDAHEYMRETALQLAESVGASDIATLIRLKSGAIRPVKGGGTIGDAAPDGTSGSSTDSLLKSPAVGVCVAIVLGQPACDARALVLALEDAVRSCTRSADTLGGFRLPLCFARSVSQLWFPSSMWTPSSSRTRTTLGGTAVGVGGGGGGMTRHVPLAVRVAAMGKVFCEALCHRLLPAPTAPLYPSVEEWSRWWRAMFDFAMTATFHASSEAVVARLLTRRLPASRVIDHLHSTASERPACPALPLCWTPPLSAVELAQAEAGVGASGGGTTKSAANPR